MNLKPITLNVKNANVINSTGNQLTITKTVSGQNNNENNKQIITTVRNDSNQNNSSSLIKKNVIFVKFIFD